jgi:tetratricopeptide (TPR) repeat protein
VRRTAFILCFLVCAVAIAFGNTLSYGFVWDDHFLIGGSSFVRHWSAIPKIFTSHFWSGHADWKMYYRPLINVTYLVDYQVWQLKPLGYHLTNVVAHTAVSLLVFRVCSLLLGDWLTAFVAALVFAIHPVHSQSVSFIAGRTDVVATLFFLIAFILYHRWRVRGGGIEYAGSAAAFLLALLSKEVAVVLPVVLVAYEWAFPREPGLRPFLRRVARGVTPLLALLGAFLAVRVLVLSDVLLTRATPGWDDPGPRILTTIKVISWYAWVTIVPYPVSPSQSTAMVRSALDPQFLLAAAGLVPLVAGTVLAALRARVACFFALWFWLTIAPAGIINLLPGSSPLVADRFLYLPSVGLCVLFALGVRRLVGDVHDIESEQVRRAPMIAFAAALVLFAILTIWRNEYWKDDLRLYYRMEDTDPQSLLAAVNLGLMHLTRLEAQEATVDFEKAAAIAPDNARVLVGYGLLLAETGKPDEGLQKALRGLGFEPREGSLHSLVGRIYVIKGDFDRASAHYREAARLQPHVPGNHFLLAYTLLHAKHVPQAAKAFEEGLEAARLMRWHHPVVERVGGELYAELDPPRAMAYWERYAASLRSVPEPTPATKAELHEAEDALRKLAAKSR